MADHPNVAQVSLPMRIALAAVLAFAALWFAALRPKPVTEDAVPAPAPVAQDATKTPAASAPKTESAGTPAKAAAKPAKPVARKHESRAVRNTLADIDRGKVVVVLFWEPAGADDKAVRSAVEQVDTHGGKVAVHAWNISRVGDFEPITRGVPVVMAPTVMVIDRDRKARTIEGLTQPREIDDLVTAALR